MSDHRLPSSYTTFRAIIGVIVILAGAVLALVLLAWVLPSLGIDVTALWS